MKTFIPNHPDIEILSKITLLLEEDNVEPSLHQKLIIINSLPENEIENKIELLREEIKNILILEMDASRQFANSILPEKSCKRKGEINNILVPIIGNRPFIAEADDEMLLELVREVIEARGRLFYLALNPNDAGLHNFHKK